MEPDSAFSMKMEVCLSMQVTPLVGELMPHRQLQNPGAQVPSTESMRSRAHALQEDRAAAGEAHMLQRRLGSARKKRMDEQLDPTVYCRKLDSISWDKPRWKRTLKRMDICVKRVTFL